MTAKLFKWPVALFVFSIAISAGMGISLAQGYQTPSGQNPPADKGTPAPAPVNKAEEDAYKAFYAAHSGNPATQIQLGEDFVAKYPQSHYASSVYGSLTSAYFSTGQEDKMFTVGTKALELNPDNVDVLCLLAMAIPRRIRSTTPDAAQQMQKAEEYGHHAIELIPTITKPPEMDDATFEKTKNDKLALAHSGLGLIDLNHGKNEDARTELMQAVQLASSPDPVDYFLLGNADRAANYFNDAIAAYGKCAASGPLTSQCKARQDLTKQDATTKMGR